MCKLSRVAVAVVALAAAITALVTDTAPADAQANRTFVSGHGTDSGTCPVTAPCRSFAYAVTQTANAGEVTVLDSAGYGPVTIMQSLTITNPGGVEAGVTAATGGTAIMINSAAAADVTLRGLTLEGGGTGTNGIDLVSALPRGTTSTLTVVDCVVKDFTVNGIIVSPGLSGLIGTPPTLNVLIQDSVLVKNALNGLAFGAQGNVAIVPTIYRMIADSNGTGINLTRSFGSLDALIADVRADSNDTAGIANTGGSIIIKHSTSEHTGAGSANDVQNAGNIYLVDRTVVGSLSNTAAAFSDGSNIIFNVSGTAPTKLTSQ